MNQTLNNLKNWLGEALEFTLGNPFSHNQMPPAIGPQPYHDKPQKSH